jgi:hypothetical protein
VSIGLQPFSIIVWISSSGLLEYVPSEDQNLKFEAIQVSSLQASSGNISPVHSMNGIYNGEINFSEPGDWEVSFFDKEFDPPELIVSFMFSL